MDYKRKSTIQPKSKKIEHVPAEENEIEECKIEDLMNADKEIDSAFMNLVNRL